MAKSILISGDGLSGQTFHIVFYPSNGGVVDLGVQRLPYVFISDHPYGSFAVNDPSAIITCTPIVTLATPTPTPNITPTISGSTPNPTQTNTPTFTPSPTPSPTNRPSPTPTCDFIILTLTPTPTGPTPTPSSSPTPTPTECIPCPPGSVLVGGVCISDPLTGLSGSTLLIIGGDQGSAPSEGTFFYEEVTNLAKPLTFVNYAQFNPATSGVTVPSNQPAVLKDGEYYSQNNCSPISKFLQTYDSNWSGTTVPISTIGTTNIWRSNMVGPPYQTLFMKDTIKVTTGKNQWVDLNICLTATTTQLFHFFLAADDICRLKIDDEWILYRKNINFQPFYGNTSIIDKSFASDGIIDKRTVSPKGITLSYNHVLPITLSAGVHNIQFGFADIFNFNVLTCCTSATMVIFSGITTSQLANISTYSALSSYVAFSTKNLINTNQVIYTDNGNGYGLYCPTNSTLVKECGAPPLCKTNINPNICPPTPTASPSPTPITTLTPTPTSSLTPTPTITPTRTLTPTPTITPSRTPVGQTLTPTPSSTQVGQTPDPTQTNTPTLTPTNSPSPTNSPTPSPTPSRTSTPTPTRTSTPTPTLSPTPSITPSPSPTNRPSPTPTPSNTLTPTITPTNTLTPTITPTRTLTPTPTPSRTSTPTPTRTSTPTPTPSPSNTLIPTVTSSPTPSPSNTLTPTVTVTPGITSSPTPTPTRTSTPTPTRTSTPTPSPTNRPSPTPSNTSTPTPTLTPTVTVTPGITSSPTPTPSRTSTPTPSPTPSRTSTPTPTRTSTPTPTSSNSPTPSVTPTPTITPTIAATNRPSPTPSNTLTPTPTLSPTVTLTPGITSSPTPTPSRTSTPTPSPTPSRTSTPTPTFTLTPTPTRTSTPTPTFTLTPTITPTIAATNRPSPSPTSSPTPTPSRTSTPTPTNTTTPTPTPSRTSTPTPSPTPSRTSTPTPTRTSTPTPTRTSTPTPTRTSTPTPTPTCTIFPTASPTPTCVCSLLDESECCKVQFNLISLPAYVNYVNCSGQQVYADITETVSICLRRIIDYDGLVIDKSSPQCCDYGGICDELVCQNYCCRYYAETNNCNENERLVYTDCNGNLVDVTGNRFTFCADKSLGPIYPGRFNIRLLGCCFPPTPTQSPMPTPQPTPTRTSTPTPTRTSTPTPTPSKSPSPTPSPTPRTTSSPTPTPSKTSTPTLTPSPTPTPTLTCSCYQFRYFASTIIPSGTSIAYLNCSNVVSTYPVPPQNNPPGLVAIPKDIYLCVRNGQYSFLPSSASTLFQVFNLNTVCTSNSQCQPPPTPTPEPTVNPQMCCFLISRNPNLSTPNTCTVTYRTRFNTNTTEPLYSNGIPLDEKRICSFPGTVFVNSGCSTFYSVTQVGCGYCSTNTNCLT